MPVIIKAPIVEADLDEIWEHIAKDSPRSATAFLRRLGEKFHLLAANPQIGNLRNELALGLRGFPVGNYLIFYRIITDGIEIARVLHGMRDIPSLFEEEQ